MGPIVAAVRRLVDAEAGLGVTGAVWLACSDVEGIARGIAWVECHRADRVRAEAAGDESPVRRGRKAVVGSPDAAAGSADVDAALRLTTVRRNRKRGRAAGRRIVVAAERQDRREVGDARPDQCPVAGSVLAFGQTLCFDVCPRLLGIQRVLDGHLGRGICAVQVILLRCPEDVHLLGITRRNVVTVPTIAGLSAGSGQHLGAQLRGEGGCRASAGRAVAGRQHGGCHRVGCLIQRKSCYLVPVIDSIRITPISPERPQIDDYLTIFPNDGVELRKAVYGIDCTVL